MTIGLKGRMWARLQFSKPGFWSPPLLGVWLKQLLGHSRRLGAKETLNWKSDSLDVRVRQFYRQSP